MKKHIEYIEVTHHGMKGILITEQSHRGSEFGYKGHGDAWDLHRQMELLYTLSMYQNLTRD